MTTSHDSAELLALAQRGDMKAIEDLISRLDPHLKLVVRRRLPRLLRRRYDSADFVQAVWASFLIKEGLDDRFETTDAVGRYLGAAAGNKVLMAVRSHLETAARDMRLEVDIARTGPDDSEAFSIGLVSRHAGPASEALADDLRDTQAKSLPEELRTVLALREQGHSVVDIAKEMGLSTRSIERALAKLRERFS